MRAALGAALLRPHGGVGPGAAWRRRARAGRRAAARHRGLEGCAQTADGGVRCVRSVRAGFFVQLWGWHRCTCWGAPWRRQQWGGAWRLQGARRRRSSHAGAAGRARISRRHPRSRCARQVGRHAPLVTEAVRSAPAPFEQAAAPSDRRLPPHPRAARSARQRGHRRGRLPGLVWAAAAVRLPGGRLCCFGRARRRPRRRRRGRERGAGPRGRARGAGRTPRRRPAPGGAAAAPAPAARGGLLDPGSRGAGPPSERLGARPARRRRGGGNSGR